MKKIFFLIFLFISNLLAVCSATPSNLVKEIFKLDYSAMLPLKIAGITILSGRMPDTINQVNQPICICPAPPPIFIRIGIPVGFFNPSRLIDASKDSYCFESVGVNLGMHGNDGVQAGDPQSGEHTFFQTHMVMFAPFELLDIATDFICLQSPSSLDVLYMTELDPMWNDDGLAALIQPEALLFGNPVTNLACIADSISAQADRSNPALFWCKGSWGNAYPMTGRVTSGDLVQASASAASELIYKLHRQLMMWATWGKPALCKKYPSPIWEKDAYRMQLLFPISHPAAMAIGKTGLMWDFAKNIPMKGDNFTYIIFIKRDCCAF
jgi:conjugal transfer pilus assembly protein TraU